MRGFWARLAETNLEFFEKLFERAKRLLPGTPRYGVIFFHDKQETSMGEITVPDTNQALTANVTFMDADGNQTTPDDVPQWTSSDESVASVSADEAGTSATVQVAGVGATVIEVRTTDDDGDEHVFQGTVTVQPGDVEVGEITFSEGGNGGEPEPVS